MMTKEQENQQICLGYFATIMLALLAATWAGGFAASVLANVAEIPDIEPPRGVITSAMFFAVCFANPVAHAFGRLPMRALCLRASFGLVFGAALQFWFIEPFVGDALSRFALLFVGALGVPLMILRDMLDANLIARGTSMRAVSTGIVVRVFSWPDRVLFVCLMMSVFMIFSATAETVEQTLIGLAGIMVIMTAVVAIRSQHEKEDRARSPEFDAWLDLIPEAPDEPEPLRELGGGLRKIGGTFATGAAFFGGLTWLGVVLVPIIHPALVRGSGSDLSTIAVTTFVALTGLAIVFFGALLSAGLAMTLLQIFGHYAHWSKPRIQSARLRMLRTLSFRPMQRSRSKS